MFRGKVTCARNEDGHALGSGFCFESLEEFIRKLLSHAQSVDKLSKLQDATIVVRINPKEEAEGEAQKRKGGERDEQPRTEQEGA